MQAASSRQHAIANLLSDMAARISNNRGSVSREISAPNLRAKMTVIPLSTPANTAMRRR
jgi:hypothetical protein